MNENQDEIEILLKGWDAYAALWRPEKFAVVEGCTLRHLGDEWTGESHDEGLTYGLPPAVLDRFERYIEESLLDPHLPRLADQGLEIGPGGGRITQLLAPRTKTLYLAEPSCHMVERLKTRFGGLSHLRYFQTDGLSLPDFGSACLDYVFSFDVFVHFEPRLVYWYLRQFAAILKEGGVGIIHYANVFTSIGWRQFENQLARCYRGRTHFGTFGVMCPPLMEKFLIMLGLEIISLDTRVIPRDAIAVFRKQ